MSTKDDKDQKDSATTDNTVAGDVNGQAVHSRTVTGIVNLGGTNTVENCAVGDGATIINN